VRLVYHRGFSYSEFDLANYAYLRNLLSNASAKVSSKLGGIAIVADTNESFWDATKRVRHLGKKGLPTPTVEWGKGGRGLGTSLLLYGEGDGELEYFWTRRESVEKALEEILSGGPGWLAEFG